MAELRPGQPRHVPGFGGPAAQSASVFSQAKTLHSVSLYCTDPAPRPRCWAAGTPRVLGSRPAPSASLPLCPPAAARAWLAGCSPLGPWRARASISSWFRHCREAARCQARERGSPREVLSGGEVWCPRGLAISIDPPLTSSKGPLQRGRRRCWCGTSQRLSRKRCYPASSPTTEPHPSAPVPVESTYLILSLA